MGRGQPASLSKPMVNFQPPAGGVLGQSALGTEGLAYPDGTAHRQAESRRAVASRDRASWSAPASPGTQVVSGAKGQGTETGKLGSRVTTDS